MFVIGTTKKLKDELEIDLEEFHEEEVETGDMWHMNLFKIGRYKCITLMHDVTLYTVTIMGVKKQHFMNIQEVLLEHLEKTLQSDGYNPFLIKRLIDSGQKMTFTKTHDRSTLGCLKEVINRVTWVYDTGEALMAEDPVVINDRNNRFVHLKLKGYPVELMGEYLEKLAQ